MRFIIPIILILLAIAGFFLLISPMYNDLSVLQSQKDSYNQALTNSKLLENERDKLTKKYNSIDPTNLDKLEKLLPNSVDNIKLILEIERIASPYGMVLKDISYDSETEEDADAPTPAGGAPAGGVSTRALSRDIGVWNLEFSTEGSYQNFLNFTRDLEKNLRIVDIAGIQFSSGETTKGDSTTESYKYSFKIKTYWLKN